MASSMLFTAKNRAAVFSSANPNGAFKAQLSTGDNVRVTSIWDYNTTTGSAVEVGENETPDGGNIIKMLYCDKVGFVRNSDLAYQRNFTGDYQSASLLNATTYSEKSLNLLYGPDSRAPIKTSVLSGVMVTVTRQKDGYYFVTASNQQGWVLASDLNLQAKVTLENKTMTYDTVTDGSLTSKDMKKMEGYQTKIKDGKFFKIDDEITGLINSAGIYSRQQIEWYDKFNRFGCLDAFNNVTTTREYLFFTKPDLHMFENNEPTVLNEELKTVPIFSDAMKRYNPVMRQLQASSKGNTSQFVKLLSNSVKSSLELPTITANEFETATNIYGTTLSYRGTSVTSDEAFDFTLEFEDTKYLEIYMYFKLFDEYERRKFFGTITPPDMNYIYRKRLHDQISIYKFIVGEDGETIIYWAKLFGCYPKGAPREAFSDMSAGGGLRFSVQWRAQFVEDMDPQILSDFNKLIANEYKNTYTTELWLYDQKLEAPDGRWAGIPYIAVPYIKDKPLERNEMEHKYMLKWRI